MKESAIIKAIAYTIIPILIFIILASSVCIIYANGNIEILENETYYNTEDFKDTYLENIQLVLINDLNKDRIYSHTIQSGEYKINYDNYMKRQIKYLIVDDLNKQAYTNIELTGYTDTIEKLKSIITKNKYSWNYENKNINTNIETLNKENIKYENEYKTVEEKINEGTIYTAIEEKTYYEEEMRFNLLKTFYMPSIILLPMSILALILDAIYILISIGYKKGHKGIYLNKFDKCPLEIILVSALIIIVILIAMFKEITYKINYITDILPIITALLLVLLGYIIVAITGVTIIKRIKAKTIFKDTITYKIIKWLTKTTKQITKSTFSNLNITIKLGIAYIVFVFAIMLITILLEDEFSLFLILLLLTLTIGTFYIIKKQINQLMKIKQAIKQIYEGKEDVKLEEQEYKGQMKETAKYINDISGGFKNAIEERIKSEKMKTELITNVSHDIKTPLTSIINYIDLIKKEKIDNKKIEEYLVILEQKSQRLKKLTEDLVEASKASSGNIKLNIEKINIKELIKQITGEYQDKFKEKNLEIITNLPKEEIKIQADSRYMHRILENLYSNTYKYALPKSRVYIEAITQNNNVLIQIKNISEQKLNITEEELMQRFVRGDSSRNTEGSGLGLSIAKSLTDLQGGKFEIYLDGDLFKVTLEFEKT